MAESFLEILRNVGPFQNVAKIQLGEPDEYFVSVCPFEEDVCFSQKGRTVSVSAKTSSAGPGYHAYLVEILDILVKAERLIVKDAGEWSDETGYWVDRDFAKLQSKMGDFLKLLVDILSENTGGSKEGPRMLCMSIGSIPLDFDACVLTPRGPRADDFFTPDVQAKDFFPWWDFGISPLSAYSICETLLWSSFAWRAPLDRGEENIVKLIRSLIDVASQDLGLEVQENLDTQAFDRARTSEKPPQATGIGYRRKDTKIGLGERWSIRIPGYFMIETDKENGRVVFRDHSRLIYHTILNTTSGISDMPQSTPEKNFDVAANKEGVAYNGNFSTIDDQERAITRLSGIAVRDDSCAIVSIVFEDDDVKHWAAETFLSLRFEQPLQ